ncbi:hypothetical protein Ahy_A02g006726 [Arachis hypogaea]|uniref:Uncharacterized protein n=1 Tax=Arachis hypogaea TaxID=3818 RepID=A0A445EB42_ARAHY|nr:hypothetical protein Ahy_A02g006726 [Arachis hypogaea]
MINEATERRVWKPWWETLIVKLLGRKIGYVAMKRRLEAMWSNKGSVDVIDLGAWEPNFNPLITTTDKIIAWLRLLRFPIELYDRTVLRNIRNIIRRTTKVDKKYHGSV